MKKILMMMTLVVLISCGNQKIVKCNSEIPVEYNNYLDSLKSENNLKIIKVCSIQTKMLNTAAGEYTDIKFYSITMDTPFTQERFQIFKELHLIL